MKRATHETFDIPALDIRAEIGSIDVDARTAELIFSTGAAVERMDWWSGKRYQEVLSLDPKHVRLDRLNKAGSLLDSHSAWSVSDILGSVVPGSARIEKGKAVATVKFSKRAAVDEIFRDVQEGVIRSVSVGYRVHKFEEDASKDNKIPVRTAVDWEPYEISLVPMPADAGARVRSEKPTNTNPCVIVRAAQEEAMERENPTPETPQVPAQTPATTPIDAAAVRAEATQAERARAKGIRDAVRVANLDTAVADELIGRDITLDVARAEIFTKLAERSAQNPTTQHVRTIGEDARDKWIRGVSAWLLLRTDKADLVARHEKMLAEKDNRQPEAIGQPGEFRGLTLIDLARQTLERAGVDTRGMDKMAIAGHAMAYRSGYQTTSDFATVLENVMHKVLRAAYALQPDTWSRWCGTTSVSDFRTHNWYRMGSLTELDAITEHGEFTNKSIPDAEKQTYSASTRGNIIAISRQVIVNDDISFVMRLSEAFGRAGKLTIEKRAYTRLAENSDLGPALSDTKSIFHADHSNISTSAALSVAAIDADRVKMAQQKDVNSVDFLDLRPEVLLVPIGLGGAAREVNAQEYNDDSNKHQRKPNVVRGLFRDVVDTPRLSGTRRYLFANPASDPVMVVSFLEGQREPVLESEDGWRTDGVELRARLDFGVDGVDFRSAITNAGV